jgi:hypothetical protein
LHPVEILAACIQQAVGLGFQNARDQTFAQDAALSVAAIGIETESHHRPALAHHVRDHGHDTQGHT